MDFVVLSWPFAVIIAIASYGCVAANHLTVMRERQEVALKREKALASGRLSYPVAPYDDCRHMLVPFFIGTACVLYCIVAAVVYAAGLDTAG